MVNNGILCMDLYWFYIGFVRDNFACVDRDTSKRHGAFFLKKALAGKKGTSPSRGNVLSR
jgi:hypothetical protein